MRIVKQLLTVLSLLTLAACGPDTVGEDTAAPGEEQAGQVRSLCTDEEGVLRQVSPTGQGQVVAAGAEVRAQVEDTCVRSKPDRPW